MQYLAWNEAPQYKLPGMYSLCKMGGILFMLSCFSFLLLLFYPYISLHVALVPVDELKFVCMICSGQSSGIACHVLIGATSCEPLSAVATLCIVQLPFLSKPLSCTADEDLRGRNVLFV